MHDIPSPAFVEWMYKRGRSSELTECEYDQVMLEAEMLKRNQLVTEIEWINMVKTANFLLLRSTTDT